jgi:hypothetical protein
MGSDESPLDAALRAKRQRDQFSANAILASTYPPDPVLDSLFKDFTERIKDRPAVPFLKIVAHNKNEHESDLSEVARGWLIRGVGRSSLIESSSPVLGPSFSMSGLCLAVATDGSPWLVAFSAPMDSPGPPVIQSAQVIPAGPSPRFGDWSQYGSLREAILWSLDMQAMVTLDTYYGAQGSQLARALEKLPAFIAEKMAETIDEIGSEN